MRWTNIGATTLFVAIVVCQIGRASDRDSPVPPIKEISTIAAEENLTMRVEPAYPASAKAARVQGEVIFQVVITTAGEVTDMRLIRGHPLLVLAAKEAIQKWQFKPFLEDGQPVPVRTKLLVSFSIGIPTGAYEREQLVAKEFFKKLAACRADYKAKQYQDAEQLCEGSLQLTDKLDPERKLERVDVHGLYGQLLLAEHKLPEALEQFKQELSIAATFLKPTDAELAYAHYHVAVGEHANGHAAQALPEYLTAEEILTAARQHMGDDELKQHYAGTLKQILQMHARLLTQTGDLNGAKELEARAQALP
jgi:TonB family protein